MKHARPLTPQGAPSPYPIRFGPVASYAIVAALDARLAVAAVDAARIAVRIAAGGSAPDRHAYSSAWFWANRPPLSAGSGPWAFVMATADRQPRDQGHERRTRRDVGSDGSSARHRDTSSSGTERPSGTWRRVGRGSRGGERQAAVRGEQDPAGRQPEAAAGRAAERSQPESVGDGPEVGAARPVRADGTQARTVAVVGLVDDPRDAPVRHHDGRAGRLGQELFRAPVAASVATSGHGNPRHAPKAITRPPATPTIGPRAGSSTSSLEPSDGSNSLVRHDTSPHDWTTSRSPSTDQASSVDHVRPNRPSGAGAGRTGRAGVVPSSGRDQIPRSARSRRATRAS